MTELLAGAVEAIFRLVDREIWLVTAQHEDRRSGLVATFAMQASIDPESPLVVVGMAPNHFTGQLARESGAFGLHLITPDQIEWVWQFALSSGRDHDKLAGIAVLASSTGSPIIQDALAWMDCRVIARYDAGDRIYFWADIVAAGTPKVGTPLTESVLLAAASTEQKRLLQANLLRDQALHKPLRERWHRELAAKTPD